MDALISERRARFDPRFFAHPPPSGATPEACEALRTHLLDVADVMLSRACALAAHRMGCGDVGVFKRQAPTLERSDVEVAAETLDQ